MSFFSILYIVLTFTIVVFIHEMGHYLVGIWRGLKAKEFAVGFGPSIFSYLSSSGTNWRVGVIPIGGYVMFEDPNDIPDAEYRPFDWLIMTLAGPIANYMLSIVLFIGTFSSFGYPESIPVITSIHPQSILMEHGVQLQDRIIKLDDHDISSPIQIRRYIGSRDKIEPNLSVQLIQADGLIKNIEVPYESVKNGFGIEMSMVKYERLDVADSITKSLNACKDVTFGIFKLIASLVCMDFDQVKVGGPIMIVTTLNNAVEYGIGYMIMIVAMISLNIGAFNLLPIPILDGGRAVVQIFEIMLGRRMGSSIGQAINMVGVVMMMSLFAYVMVSDILSIWR